MKVFILNKFRILTVLIVFISCVKLNFYAQESSNSKKIVFYFLEKEKTNIDSTLFNEYFKALNNEDSLIFILITNSHCHLIGKQQFNNEKETIYNDLVYNIFNVADKIDHKQLDGVKILKSTAEIYNSQIQNKYENKLISNHNYEIDFILDVDDINRYYHKDSKLFNLFNNIRLLDLIEEDKVLYTIYYSNKLNEILNMNSLNNFQHQQF